LIETKKKICNIAKRVTLLLLLFVRCREQKIRTKRAVLDCLVCGIENS